MVKTSLCSRGGGGGGGGWGVRIVELSISSHQKTK